MIESMRNTGATGGARTTSVANADRGAPSRPARPAPRFPVLRLGAVVAVATLAGCAGLGRVLGVEPPRFERAGDRESTVRLRGPSFENPRGAATVRIWARVSNPNGFGFTLSTLTGALHLEDTRVADLELPLGLPLAAAGDTVIPLEFTFPIPELGAVADLARALVTRSAVSYQLEGTVGVDAGPLGEPRFGPRTWLQGELDVRAFDR